MNDSILTGIVVGGNILATTAISLITNFAANKYIKNEKINMAVTTVVPCIAAVGIAATTSGIITEAYSSEDYDTTEDSDAENDPDIAAEG